MQEVTGRLGKYNRIALYVVLAFLVLTSFLMADYAGSGGLTGVLKLCCGFLLCLILVYSLHIASEPVLPKFQDRSLAVCFGLLLLLSSSGALVPSLVHLAAIALLWAQYCLLKELYFAAFFLMGISSMFFPPVMWIAILVMLLMLLAGLTDKLRNILKFIGGLSVPFFLYGGVAYIIGEDVLALGAGFWHKMIFVEARILSLNIPLMFLILCILFVSIHAIVLLASKMGEYGIEESYALKVQIINFVVCSAVFIFFSATSSLPIAILSCCPTAVLLSRYFSQWGGRWFARIEIVVLLCAAFIARLGYFIV